MASTTLTWQNSGLYNSKSGTTDVAMFTDLIALMATYASNSAFSWQVVGSNITTPNTSTSGSPYYVLLSRKSADPDMPIATFGSITGGSAYTNGTYSGVALTGGKGSAATANITVSGGAVTAVTLVNPGDGYVVGDALSATAASIGGTGSGFSIPVATTSTAGRLMLFSYAVAPSFYNTNLFDVTPTATICYLVWFPEGTGTAPSATALVPTSATGSYVTMTVDTNSGKVVNNNAGSVYGASFLLSYMDSADAFWLMLENPVGVAAVYYGGGLILVDYNDIPYDGYSVSTNMGSNLWGSAWTAGGFSAGSYSGVSSLAVRAPTYGGGRTLYGAYAISPWMQQSPGGSTDILYNSTTNNVSFSPIPLMSITKGDSVVLKLRQLAIGPNTTGQFQTFSSSGPVIAAQALSSFTGATSAGSYWATNFKV